MTDGICIHFDGFGKHIYGNAATKQQDQSIRTYNFVVLEIPASHLNNLEAVTDFFYQLTRKLTTKKRAEKIDQSQEWKI